MKKFKQGDVIEVRWYDSRGEAKWMSDEDIKNDILLTRPLISRGHFVDIFEDFIVIALTFDPNNFHWSGRQEIYKKCIVSMRLIENDVK